MERDIKKLKNPNLINKKFKSMFFIGILGWVVFLIGGILDNIFAGCLLSESALGAVQIINPFYCFICFVSVLASAGFGVRYSNLFGKNDKENAHKTVGQGLLFAFCCGVVLALIMLFCKEQFLSIFNLSKEVYNYASDYYDWYIGVAVIYPIYMLLYRLALFDGDALWTFASDGAQVLVNAVTSAVLVRIMGIKGLGLGTFLSISVALITVLFHYVTKRNSVKLKFGFSLKNLGICIKLGIGSALGTLFTAVVNTAMNTYVVRTYGDTYLSSFTVINFIVQFTLLFVCVPDSMGAFVATASGSKNTDDLKLCVSIEKKWAAIISLVSTAIVCALCFYIPSIFGIAKGSEQYRYGMLAVLVISPTFICYAFQCMIGLTYNAMQKPAISLISQTTTNLVLKIVLPISLSRAFGYVGFIIGYGVLPVIGIAITFSILFIKHKGFRIFDFSKVDEIQFSNDLYLTEENIVNYLDYLKQKFDEHGIERKTKIKVLGTIDDVFHIIIRMNPNKTVLDRITVCVGEDNVRLLSKNDGRICSEEEKAKEIENKLNHVYLTYFNVEGSLNINTVVSFNYANTIIERQKVKEQRNNCTGI